MRRLFILGLSLAIIASTLCCSGKAAVIVRAGSMRPTLLPDERVVIDLNAYVEKLPARGDIVVFLKPDAPGEKHIKRVIALAGDSIVLKDDLVFLNGKPLDEPYLFRPASTNVWWSVKTELTVPPKSLYVLGDNRPASEDSRQFGVVPLANIVGRAVVISRSPDPTRIGKVL